MLALTLEKIRAGVLPVPAEKIIDRITQHAWRQGLDLRWEREEGLPVAIIRYTPHEGRDDVVLEQLQIRSGQIRLAGRSVRGKGIVGVPRLPTRKVLQSKFPRRNVHDHDKGDAPSPRGEPAQLHLAHELNARQADHDPVRGPVEDVVPPSVHAPDRPPSPRDRAFILQIQPTMVGEGTGRQFDPRHDRRVDGPGAQDLAPLEHQVPVHPVPVVLQDHEAVHPLTPRSRQAGGTFLGWTPHRPRVYNAGGPTRWKRSRADSVRASNAMLKELMMDKAQMIDKLNEILKWEYAGLVQYTQFSFLVQDTWREVFSKFFRENGEEALEHAHLVGDKIVALGGVTTVERGEVKQSTDLHEMLEYSLEVESKQVELYTEALELCGPRDVALRVLLEDICRQEQEGVDHLEKLLKKRELAITGSRTSQGQKAG